MASTPRRPARWPSSSATRAGRGARLGPAAGVRGRSGGPPPWSAAPPFGGAAVRRRRHVAAAALAMPHAELAVGRRAWRRRPRRRRSSSCSPANPGSPPLPLTRVASGGELARTMLALRLAPVDAPSGRAGAVDARVRRGRRRHRRSRGGRRGRGTGRRGERPPGARRHPSRPGRRAWRRPPVTVSKRVAGGHTHDGGVARRRRRPRRRVGPHAVGRRRRRGGPPARRPAARRRRSRPDARGRGRLGSRPAGNPGNPHQRDGGPRWRSTSS